MNHVSTVNMMRVCWLYSDWSKHYMIRSTKVRSVFSVCLLTCVVRDVTSLKSLVGAAMALSCSRYEAQHQTFFLPPYGTAALWETMRGVRGHVTLTCAHVCVCDTHCIWAELRLLCVSCDLSQLRAPAVCFLSPPVTNTHVTTPSE